MLNIKCIASDVDGTLVEEGSKNINPEYFSIIKQLKEKDILFVLCSGRQYTSMQRTFEPVINDAVFICDNGAYVSYQGFNLGTYSIPNDICVDVVQYLRTIPNIYYQFSTPTKAYTECKDEELINQFQSGYQIDITLVEDLTVIEEPIIKIAVYNKEQDATILAEQTRTKYQDKVDVVVSGDYWFDFVQKGISKGSSLQAILNQKNITKEECMAFGDNDNDIPMLDCAQASYAVSTARESVKKAVKMVLPDKEDAVLDVLKGVLNPAEETLTPPPLPPVKEKSLMDKVNDFGTFAQNKIDSLESYTEQKASSLGQKLDEKLPEIGKSIDTKANSFGAKLDEKLPNIEKNIEEKGNNLGKKLDTWLEKQGLTENKAESDE